MTTKTRRPRWARACTRLAHFLILTAVHLTRWVADSEAEALNTVADLASDAAIELAPDIRSGLKHIRHYLPKAVAQPPGVNKPGKHRETV